MSQAMPNFDTFFNSITDVLPKSLLSMHQDLEKNLRVALDSGLRKMNLVTREEFEVQTAVLERTRSSLEALEARVALLEGARQEASLFDQTFKQSET
ncbi:MAG: accessory factor UbiK family protein [Pseudomonadota bacterium]